MAARAKPAPAPAPALNLGHGLVSTTAPSIEDAARLCGYLAEQFRWRVSRTVALGNAPDATVLLDAAILDLAQRTLGTVAAHEQAVKRAVIEDRNRQRAEEYAAEQRRERGRMWAERKRREAANG